MFCEGLEGSHAAQETSNPGWTADIYSSGGRIYSINMKTISQAFHKSGLHGIAVIVKRM